MCMTANVTTLSNGLLVSEGNVTLFSKLLRPEPDVTIRLNSFILSSFRCTDRNDSLEVGNLSCDEV